MREGICARCGVNCTEVAFGGRLVVHGVFAKWVVARNGFFGRRRFEDAELQCETEVSFAAE